MKILILSHANSNSGAIDRYEEYLKREGHDVIKFEQPLDNYCATSSKLWEDGHLVHRVPRRHRGLFNLLEDLKLSLGVFRRVPSSTVVGANNFDAFSAIMGRHLFRPRAKVIYFASDFSEKRYSSAMLNRAYLLLERLALKGADLVISNTRRAEAKRLELGLQRRKSLVVVNAAHLNNPTFPYKPLPKERFVYVGSLTHEHGLRDFLTACPDLVRHLTIIGDGPDKQDVLEACRSGRIDCTYLGQQDHDWTMSFMRCFEGLALAPYSLAAARYVYYGSSLKIFEYLACGLPVITSNVTEQSELVSGRSLGIVYHQVNQAELIRRVGDLSLKDFNQRAWEFYTNFNQDKQFQQVHV